MLALIAENRNSPTEVDKVLKHTSVPAQRIAKHIVTPGAGKAVRKSDKQTADAIRRWAATNNA